MLGESFAEDLYCFLPVEDLPILQKLCSTRQYDYLHEVY